MFPDSLRFKVNHTLSAGVACSMGLTLLVPTGSWSQNPPAQNAMEQILSPATAVTLLQGPANMDEGSRKVIKRAELAYGKLNSLKTINRDGGMVGVAFLARPLRLRLEQKLVTGSRVALAISDGQQYYEYRERTRQYLERPAAILRSLALPVNTRLFMEGQSAAATLIGLDNKATVREYQYRYRGKVRIPGGPAEQVDVSVMVRSPDGKWHSFTSQRFYDSANGLLRRAVNGGRTMDIENYPNAKVPPGTFRWFPPQGSIKGMG